MPRSAVQQQLPLKEWEVVCVYVCLGWIFIVNNEDSAQSLDLHTFRNTIPWLKLEIYGFDITQNTRDCVEAGTCWQTLQQHAGSPHVVDFQTCRTSTVREMTPVDFQQ